MIFSRLLQLALVVMALAGPSAPAFARFMQANNSFVVLDLPESFRPERRFAGFYSKEAGATIMVLDLPRNAYGQFTNRFDKELEHKGYSEVRQSKLHGRNDEHLFFFARQHTPVGQFDKYLLIIRDGKRAAYVTITVNPIEKVETPLSYIEAQNILAKVKLSNKRAVIDKLYNLTYLGLFKERNTIVGSTTIYSLKKPKEQAKSKPLFVIAPSLSQHKVADLAGTGRALMAKFSRFRDMNLTAEEQLSVDGMKGYGLSGSAIKKSSGQRVGVYQLVLANPAGGYFRIVGVAPHKKFAFFLQEFRQMASSFRLKK
ncbi:MAG: hypothetical protein L3J67_07010 [Hyphomicrobiaceae bacterium]|nr:hypothetical protein [Hyphomicrobiaceae bacterium]